MHIKFHNKHSKSLNIGSAKNIIEYLEKENIDKELFDKENFFNQYSKNIDGRTAVNILDNNHGRLSKKETKYYMVSISPSKKELEHIGSNKDALKKYVNNFMDDYAKNFNRLYVKDDPGSQLRGDDLVYFAKLETERTYKHTNKKDKILLDHNSQIKRKIRDLDISSANYKFKKKKLSQGYNRDTKGNIIKEGLKKHGENTHIHVVVSRYDKQQRFKLSPMQNARGTKNAEVGKGENRKKITAGFNRNDLYQKAEELFDKQFAYDRHYSDKFQTRKSMKGIDQVLAAQMAVNNPAGFAKMIATRQIANMVQDKSLQKALGYATTNPKHISHKVTNELKKQAVKAIMESVGTASYTNPVTAALKVTERVVRFAASTISKGAGI